LEKGPWDIRNRGSPVVGVKFQALSTFRELLRGVGEGPDLPYKIQGSLTAGPPAKGPLFLPPLPWLVVMLEPETSQVFPFLDALPAPHGFRICVFLKSSSEHLLLCRFGGSCRSG